MTPKPKNKKILIAEDEEQLLMVMSFKLEREGYSVFKAKNGTEGLKLALDVRPDLILLDIMMPVMDGMQMLKSLRLDPWGEKAKVVVLTNLTQEHAEEALKLGVKKYLVKSDSPLDQVVKIVDEQCCAE